MPRRSGSRSAPRYRNRRQRQRAGRRWEGSMPNGVLLKRPPRSGRTEASFDLYAADVRAAHQRTEGAP